MYSQEAVIEDERGTDFYQPPQSADALRYRIDTKPLVDEIKLILKGEEMEWKDNQAFLNKYGSPLLNNEGIGKILSIVKSHINSHTVQGNLKEDQLNMIVKSLKKKISLTLATNSRDWEVVDSDRKMIVMNIEHPVFVFLSRTLENKERESYGMRTVHQSQVIPKSKGFNWNFFRGGSE